MKNWDPSMHKYILKLQERKAVVWGGDMNCAILDWDVHNPRNKKQSPGFTDKERESMSRFMMESGFVDSYRMFHPRKVAYTYCVLHCLLTLERELQGGDETE